MFQKKSAVRFAAFAGVMLVVSGLVLTLFDEARAAEISIEDPGSISTTSSSVNFFVRLAIPDGQAVPIEAAHAVIENNPTDSTTKTASSNPTVAARATCADPIVGCATTSTLTNTAGTAITGITLDNFYTDFVGPGYVLGNGYTVTCTLGDPCSFTDPGAYGYTSNGGYGYAGAGVGGNDDVTSGTGYGYSLSGSAELIVRFQVSVAPGSLGAGDYWMTFLVDTGSGTIGTLSSPATAFTVTGGGGGSSGGGTGGDGGDGGDGGTGNRVTLNLNVNPNPPAGAVTSFTLSGINQDRGTRLVLTTDDDRLQDIELLLGSDISDGTVTVSRFPADSPPPGTGPLPQGVRAAGFVQVTISTGGETHTLSFSLLIPEGEAGDTDKAVLMKYNEDAGRWVPQQRMQLTLSAGMFTASGEASCCSDYAVGFDEEDPTVTFDAPDGDLSGMQTLTAEADDNLEIDRVEFFFGQTLIGTAQEAPYTVEFDTNDYANGDWTLSAVAYDFVGNSAESSDQATFSNAVDGEDGGDGTDGEDGDMSVGVIILILVVLAALIGGAVYYMRKQK